MIVQGGGEKINKGLHNTVNVRFGFYNSML